MASLAAAPTAAPAPAPAAPAALDPAVMAATRNELVRYAVAVLNHRMKVASKLDGNEPPTAAGMPGVTTREAQLDLFFGIKFGFICLLHWTHVQVDVSFDHKTLDVAFVVTGAFMQHPDSKYMVVAMNTDGKAAMRELDFLINEAQRRVQRSPGMSLEELLVRARLRAGELLAANAANAADRVAQLDADAEAAVAAAADAHAAAAAAGGFEASAAGSAAAAGALRTAGAATHAALLAAAAAANAAMNVGTETARGLVEAQLAGAAAAAHDAIAAALGKPRVRAVVWTKDKIVELRTKPMLPKQFAKVIRQAVYGDCEDAQSRETSLASLELRLLGMQPSCYVLGAGEHHDVWAQLPYHAAATAYVQQMLGATGNIVRGAVVLYHE